MLYDRKLMPGQSYTIGWTWNSGSVAEPPLKTGNYSVTAKWSSGIIKNILGQPSSYMIYWETPGVPTQIFKKDR